MMLWAGIGGPVARYSVHHAVTEVRDCRRFHDPCCFDRGRRRPKMVFEQPDAATQQ